MIEVDGIELLKMIKNQEMPYGTKIYVQSIGDSTARRFYTIYGAYRQLHLFRKDGDNTVDVRVIDTEDLIDKKFYVMMDKKNNIQDVEKLNNTKAIGLYQVIEQQNKILKEVKALNIRLEELENEYI